MRRGRSLDVAIVGLACRFPGARDVAAFWENLVAGRDCTGEVPPDRWDPSVFFDPGSTASDRVYCKRGGYLDAPVGFDPLAHGVMPIAVDGGEPEQFLVLDAAQAALADAGLARGVRDGRRVEVVIGRGNYFNRGNLTRLQHGRIVSQTLAILGQLHPDWTAAEIEAVRADLKASLPPFGPGTIPSQLTNGTAGLAANRLDLKGASFVVDAASASSLVALDLGARALVDRRADLALVGGVYLQPDVDFPMVFCRLGALSRRGEARPFARDADGTLPGEGVGVVVLKRRADAERDGDRTYAVLRGVGLASDGRGPGLAAPSARGHARALRRAYRQAGIDPATVGYLEGHGLGVPASDRAELRALNAVFPTAREGEGKCVLGASTALIGHAMPAAGMAGLIKSALALHHRVLPPTPHAESPHPMLAADDGRFTLPGNARPWIHGGLDHPRRAGVNAFGFAGISAHAVLEEHAASADAVHPGCQLRWETEAVLLAASDRGALIARMNDLIDWLDHEPNRAVPLKDLAFTLGTRGPGGACRLGLVVGTTDDLHERLRGAVERLEKPACRAIRDARGCYFLEESLARPGALAFVFAGEGAQYPGMLAELCRHFPEVRAWFDVADRVARQQGLKLLPSEPLFAAPTSAGKSNGGDGGLWSIGTAVNAVLASHWALYTLLSHLHIRPDRVLGHSSGEILALAAAGVLEMDHAMADSLGGLGTVFERLDASGLVPQAVLVAVAADRVRVEKACREIGQGLAIALDNCPHQVVVAGDEPAADRLVRQLRGEGLICDILPFARAYHTGLFRPSLGPIREFFEALPLKLPTIPIHSCAIAGRMPHDLAAIRGLAVRQWALPVEFRSSIEAMYEEGARIFVEVGAMGNLTGFIEDTLRGRPHFAVAPCMRRRSGLTQLNHMVASLFAHGVALRPDYLHARRRPERVDLDRPLAIRHEPSLAVGFPEMRLSSELAAGLRGRKPVSTNQPAAQARLPHPAKDGQANGDQPDGPFGLLDREGPSQRPGSSAATAAGNDPQGDPRAALIREHLRTMDEFLETQRQVMDAYLAARRRTSAVGNGDGTAPRSGAGELLSSHSSSPLSGARPPDPPPGPTRSDKSATCAGIAAVPDPAPPPIPAQSAEVVLLDHVSRRTGYPRSMLQLDFDMEGDLGIDSIKRVEIFGELQGDGIVPEGLDLDRLSRCHTLRQVLDLLRTRPGERRDASGARVASQPHGPWLGTVESFEAGRSLVAVRRLDLEDDPVAAEHTFGGRRVSALDPTRLGLPVVPFTVMIEMLAQAASLLVPGRVVVGLRDVQAHRWIRYEDEPVALEIRARREPGRPEEVDVAIHNRGSFASRPFARGPGDGPVVEGRVVLGDRRAAAPVAPTRELKDSRACRFDAGVIYREQWLFHGPALQAVVGVGRASPHGIEGTLRVLPRSALFRDGERPALVTDPIVLDAYTQLLGVWGLDQFGDNEGDVLFPLRVSELTIFDNDPGEGADVSCRIEVVAIHRHRVRANADLIAPDGRVWMRLDGWDDWRFYWPCRYRDHMRMPDRVFVGEPLPMGSTSGARAVWLEPPSDFGKPVWRDVIECLDLGPEERLACRAMPGPETRATLRLWGRVAAKEAARRIWAEQGRPPVYPADLRVEPDDRGRPRLRSLIEPGRTDLPAISIAHTGGVAVALASPDPEARVGIDVEAITGRAPDFERVAFDAGERAWLDRLAAPDSGADRDEWVARFWCAKEAVAKATGLGLLAGPGSVSVVGADGVSGTLAVALGDELARARPDMGNQRLRAVTARRGDRAWAWTLAERID